VCQNVSFGATQDKYPISREIVVRFGNHTRHTKPATFSEEREDMRMHKTKTSMIRPSLAEAIAIVPLT
jgi:hypothetical protein